MNRKSARDRKMTSAVGNRRRLGVAIVLMVQPVLSTMGCVPSVMATPREAPVGAAVRIRFEPPRDMTALTERGDSVMWRAVRELFARVQRVQSDALTVRVTDGRADDPPRIDAGALVTIPLDPGTRAELLSRHPTVLGVLVIFSIPTLLVLIELIVGAGL